MTPDTCIALCRRIERLEARLAEAEAELAGRRAAAELMADIDAKLILLHRMLCAHGAIDMSRLH